MRRRLYNSEITGFSMGGLMASVDVKQEINDIQMRLGVHDHILSQQSKTMDKMTDVLEKVVTVAEKQVHIEQQLEQHRDDTRQHREDTREDMREFRNSVSARFTKQDERIASNYTQIMKWSGGIAALITAVGVAATLYKLVPVG